jgi:MraZ protein
MLIGRYYHALEQKGRLSIPTALRSLLGEAVIVTAGLDGCLFLYAEKEWLELIQTSQSMPVTKKAARDWVRYLANNAASVIFDRLGRILIPDHLRGQAALEKNVVVVGSVNRVEIWDRDRYHAYLDDVNSRVETLAESLTHE